MKRVLITGSNGLLGQKLAELISRCANFELLLTSRQEHSVFDEDAVKYMRLDATRRQDVRSAVESFEPDCIVNAAAVTDVDVCETERERAWRANVGAVEHLSYAAKLAGARLIHLSTDYIFDGKQGPYSETDRPNPVSYYGKTKLASENVLQLSGGPFAIVRTMVLYGVGFGVKENFALWLARNLREEKPVKVADDQVGNPTLADDAAFAIFKLLELERTGIYHIAGSDLVSRYEFALALARLFGFNKKLITPVKSSSLKQTAPRPLKSGFITLKAETDLGMKMSGIEHGLTVLKNQMSVQAKHRGKNDS